MKGFTMKLNNINKAFEIERASYLRTIRLLTDEIEMYRAAEYDHNDTINDLKDETIKDLEIKNRDLAAEVARLEKELDQCGKKLNATQYKEYKRLKQNEYQRRWYKKSKQSK